MSVCVLLESLQRWLHSVKTDFEQFIVLTHGSHGVIMGIYFLSDCGAMLDCGAREISFRRDFLLTYVEEGCGDTEGLFLVTDDALLSAMFVYITSENFRRGSCQVLVEAGATNAVKKLC